MDIGPVEMIVLTFPGERADPAVAAAIQDVVARGYVTVLDLVFVSRLQGGQVRITDVDQNLDVTGLATLTVNAQALVSEDDLEVVRDSLEPGQSAAVIVYEESWARNVAATVRAAGGEVALHLQIPHETAAAAIEAAAI
jgi:hypothetical protein